MNLKPITLNKITNDSIDDFIFKHQSLFTELIQCDLISSTVLHAQFIKRLVNLIKLFGSKISNGVEMRHNSNSLICLAVLLQNIFYFSCTIPYISAVFIHFLSMHKISYLLYLLVVVFSLNLF